MALTGMLYYWDSASDGNSRSIDINFPPSYTVAQTSLSFVSGEGLHAVGIRSYRSRPKADGAEEQVNFSWDPNSGYPPSVFHERMTSISAQLVVGGEQQATATLNVWFFT